ncbi:MAG: hypothetical protein UT55_C0009G0004 [Candidatus Peregrinibacteria bacterium GW2011_GWE2_39_6]|nr:MAG: hypothetical protein UT36_C0014G0004 [Candidatus Peregrinibacteria bacterium GW2011_GWF2_39_17]KKR26372.1 MAG: hypothetical protein UT55_C0009G0004 [Candidatus Peregrinibacteria bacterium GW2011_GWE2_39_6]HCW32520.1 hypothetical protein [Candidatus Peregrinibacteria bacterium]
MILNRLSLGVSLILVGLFFEACTPAPISDVGFPDPKLCQATETGWDCVLTEEKGTSYSQFEDKNEEFKKACENLSGHWICYGKCAPFASHYCDLVYQDAGKSCENSNQCQGFCTIESPDDNLGNGKCAPYPLRACDRWYEVNDGVVTDHANILCD